MMDEDQGALINWRAVVRGALLALGVLALASVVEAILDHNISDFRDSAWIYPLFVVVPVAYAAGGWHAGRDEPASPLSNGTLAGVGAFVLWIPVRILIWVLRDDGSALFTGHHAALLPGQVFGHIVIAAAFGMLGGFVGGRSAARVEAGRSGRPGS